MTLVSMIDDSARTATLPKPKLKRRLPPSTQSMTRVDLLPTMSLAELVAIFKLVADETRLGIFQLLLKHGELHVRALCQHLDQSQPSVSHHLGLMYEAGLVERRREGKHNFYRVRNGHVAEALATFMGQLSA